MTSDNIPTYSVAEISLKLKTLLERNFSFIKVHGEIIQMTRHSNGHIYLSLCENNAVLRAVIWRSQIRKLRHQPDKSDHVLAFGKLTAWQGGSTYQLVIEQLEPAGEGVLLQEIEQIKKRNLHLFAQERKRPLPGHIRRIGLITSRDGAVFHDIIKVISMRFPLDVFFCPAHVQGANTVASVIAALDTLNRLSLDPPLDLVVIARGGGSLTDLMPFNSEQLIRHVAQSRLPTVSAIGHEPDTPLLDLVADVRCTTPSAAALRITPFTMEAYETRLQQSLGFITRRKSEALMNCQRALDRTGQSIAHSKTVFFTRAVIRQPPGLALQLDLRHQRLSRLKAGLSRLGAGKLQLLQQEKRHSRTAFARIGSSVKTVLARLQARTAELTELAHAVSPENVLQRGYSIVRDARTGAVITRAGQAPDHRRITLQFANQQQLPARIEEPKN